MQTKLFESFEAGGLSGESSQLESWRGPLPSNGPIQSRHRNENWIRNNLGAISFSELVRESSGFLVLPIDPTNDSDMGLLNHLSNALTDFVKLTERSGQRFTGNRINDIGKRFEYTVVEELKKTPLSVSMLGRPGYPDCVLRQGGRTTYLEIKTSGTIPTKSNMHLPSFSFSSCKKIESDARHLLLKVQFEEEENKIWKVVAWELRDLSSLKTRLKTAFNAGCADFADIQLLGSSDAGRRPLKMMGQSILDGLSECVSRRGPRSKRRASNGSH